MNWIEQKIGAGVLKAIRSRREAAASKSDQVANPPAAIAPAKLRTARFSDFQAVAELKQRGGLSADSLENWERLWRHNPALRSNEIDRPIGWVLEADGAIVGYLGNITLLYRYNGRMLTAVTAHGLVVDPPYRALGISLVAAYFRQKGVDLFISTSAIESVGKIAVAFKSLPVPQPDYSTVFFWVLRPYSFARGLMQKVKLGSALASIGAIATAFTVGVDKIVRRRWPRPAQTPYIVREVHFEEIGGAFESLWYEKQEERCRLLADRSPATLRWHFEIPGDRGSAQVLGCYRQEELLGYVVVRTDANQENGLRTSIIADTLVRNDDPEIVKTLWSAAFDCAKRAGSDVLEVVGFPASIRNVVSDWNPYRRKYPACPFYYKAADPALQTALTEEAAWYASPFDGDATLIRPSYSTSALRASEMQMQNQDSRGNVVCHLIEQEHSEVF